MSSPLTIRVATDADLPTLDRAVPTGRNDVHRGFLASQAAGKASYIVAWRDRTPVGSGLVRWVGRGDQPDPELSNLRVAQPLRGQGIGTAIVRFAEQLVRGRGYARLTIGVDEDNPRAAALYERLGYTDTGVRWTAPYTWYDQAGAPHEEVEHVRVLALPLAARQPAGS